MEGIQNIPAPMSSGGEQGSSTSADAPGNSASNSSEPRAQRGGGGTSPQTKSSAPPTKDAKPVQSSADPDVWELKVNGRTVKMSRQEALNHASMSFRANEKFNEASQINKKVEKIIATAKSNPIEALLDPTLGLTKDQVRDAFETWYAKEYIEPETLSPQERELKEYKSKLAKYEEQEKTRTQQEEETRISEMTKKELEYYQKQIMDAMEAGKLPKKNVKIAARIAHYLDQSMQNGWDAPMEMIVSQVQNERQQEFGYDMQMEIPDFLSLYGEMGEAFIQKVRQHDLQRLRANRSERGQSFQKPVSSEPRMNNNERVSSSDVDRRLKDIRMGKITW